MRAKVLLAVVVATSGCDADELPPPPPIGAATDSPGGALPAVGVNEPPSTTGTTTVGATAGSSATAGTSATAGSSASTTAGTSATTGMSTTATATATDGDDTDVTATDGSATAGVECNSACDCPPLTRCTAAGCEPSSQAVYCCGEPTCPSGEACETPAGGGGVCP